MKFHLENTIREEEIKSKNEIQKVPFPGWPSSFNSIYPCSEINDFAVIDEPRQGNGMNLAPGFYPYLTIPQNMPNTQFEYNNQYVIYSFIIRIILI